MAAMMRMPLLLDPFWVGRRAHHFDQRCRWPRTARRRL